MGAVLFIFLVFLSIQTVYDKIDSVMFNGHDFFISFNFGMFMTVKLTLFCMKVDFLKKKYNLLSNDEKIFFFYPFVLQTFFYF